jgi:hypothetical protein
MVYATVGDTIRLNADFTTFAGVGADPTTVTLNVYDELKNVVLSAGTSAGGIENGSTDGIFHYDYLTVNEGVHFYEFEGTLETHTISDKGTFYVTWA